MNLNKKKRQVQKEAVKEWSKNKFNTMILYTGMGKTWIFFDCLIKSKCKKCYILAETNVREKDIYDDRKEYIKHFGKDPFENVEIIFNCYHSAHKIKLEGTKRNKIFIFGDEYSSVAV